MSEKQIINLKGCKVWGPGLKPNRVIMPARYFFIQAVDQTNSSFLSDASDLFSISVSGTTSRDKPCRIWTNILNRKDGLFIVRYKLYEPCLRAKITIEYDAHPVADSPYIINEEVYPDLCNCSNMNMEDILSTWECGVIPEQINKDLDFFPEVNWDILRAKVISKFNKPHSVSLCHYIVKNNRIFRKCYGKYVGFNMFSDSILLSLARKVRLPDLEFFINLGDWPLSKKDLSEKYPILSWCGSDDAYDIVMPSYELTEASLENMGRIMLDMLSVQGNIEHSWEKREDKLFWRGRDSNQYRLKLIKLAKESPDFFNASLTNFFFYRDEEHIYGPKSEHVSFFDFFKYKYQIAIDGTVASYRTPFLLGGGSLIFKPHSKYYEHFYKNLKANYHYLEVEENLSDLIEKIKWARANDETARKIANNAQIFANDALLPQHVFCYYFHLLNELSKRTVSTVEVFDDMEEVKQKEMDCDCKTIHLEKDEL